MPVINSTSNLTNSTWYAPVPLLSYKFVVVGVVGIASPKIVELEPANEDYENIVVDLEYQDFHIEGKSVGLLRKN